MPLADLLHWEDFKFKIQKAYIKLNDELSFLIGFFVERHALILDIFDITVLYYFTCWWWGMDTLVLKTLYK